MSNTTRRTFLGTSLGASALLAAGERPNIILAMGDDHGWNETGYNGHPHVRTPVLDEMAATGLRFDRFYSGAPVCSPTRASVMTGRHPNRQGTFSANWSTRPEEITIAQIMKKAGYACGHFGKWHLGPVKADSLTNPGAMGFDEWLSHDNFFELDPQLSRNGAPPETFKGESSEIVVKETIRFIDKAHGQKKPFFIVLWFGSPHEPYSASESDVAPYKGRGLNDRMEKRFAEVTAMDRAMGQLRAHLKKAGVRQNTLLWYCGDNGTPGEARQNMSIRGNKGAVYEGGVRVPGIIEWPERIPKPRVTAMNAVTSDMLPTLCDITGQPLPSRPLDGISLKPLIDGGAITERKKPICFWVFDTARESKLNPEPYLAPARQEGTTPTVKLMGGKLTRSFRNLRHPRITDGDYAGPAAILGDRYKLVAPKGMVDGAGPLELYDVRADPNESKDLIQSQPEIAKQMRRELREWQASVLKSLTGADYK